MSEKTPGQQKSAGNGRPTSKSKKEDFLIVGLGASAGGIQALKEFFAHVPKDSGIAYVVILHMSPEHESKLAEVLQVSASIPVIQVRQGAAVKPDHVYVIPPNQNLAMTDGHLSLTNMIAAQERRSPVDLFFRTLAETNDSRAVSVILSGTGANGSMGLKRIKEGGGVAFAQDPAEAQYSDMPQNAILTGLVDFVLPVAEIPQKIFSYNEHRGSVQIPAAAEEDFTDEQALRDVFVHLRSRTGHDSSNYKRATMLPRIERRIGLHELDGLQQYSKFLKEDLREPKALMKDLLISVTNFFRDQESMEVIGQRIIPEIVKNKREDDAVRVWIAGCATGEEAYSIAMMLNETLSPMPRPLKLQVFASDLDADAVAVAREGFYSEAEVADLTAERLQRFFLREYDGYRIRREIREQILFAEHNIIKDPPFSRLDLITCRNVLIYLNRSAQSRILETIHFALNSGGYLFLGSSESVEVASDFFTTVDKEHHVFQSRPVPTRPVFPVPDISLRPPPTNLFDRQKTFQELKAIERLEYVDLHQRLLEEIAPPSVVINEEYEIVHLSDHAGAYLQITGGEPTNNLLKLIRPELRIDLRTALYQAVQNRQPVETHPLKVQTDDGVRNVRLNIRTVFREGDGTKGFLLVAFAEDGPTRQPFKKPPPETASGVPIAKQLEDELIHSKSQLRATVEQYEVQQEELRASNEELQAMNEELRSAAEELETSKEELQSINEELTTVNQELKIKIEELSQSNNDFTNLMNSTDIGTIFLDRGQRVKLFTPRARDTFNLIPSDINRPLLHITHKFLYEGLESDLDDVTSTLHKVEREVETVDHRWYMMRILPYRTSDDLIDGIVLTVLDITPIKNAATDLETARGEIEIKVDERTSELRTANVALFSEVEERRQSEEVRHRLLAQLVRAQEAERRRLARDLHDQLGQQLTALRLTLETLKGESERREDLGPDIDALLAITEQLDSDIDFLAWELRPLALDDLGLSDALRVYVRRWSEHFNIVGQFHSDGFETERLLPELENHLYRVTQEALNNVAKHSKASQVEVLLEKRGRDAVLIIEDNGVGLSEPPQNYHTMGMTSMRERIALVAGKFDIEFTPGKGTTIFVRVPIEIPKE